MFSCLNLSLPAHSGWSSSLGWELLIEQAVVSLFSFFVVVVAGLFLLASEVNNHNPQQ